MLRNTRSWFMASLLCTTLAGMSAAAWAADEAASAEPAAAAETKARSTSDHRKFEELAGPFRSGPEVTTACLKCHTEAAKQIHKSKHWKWEFENPVTGQKLGKKTVINNFCGTVQSNEPRCTSCHIGYGWKDAKFDFTVEKNVDCLVCHDTSGKYRKWPTGAGHPLYKEIRKGKQVARPVDLAKVAQSVGKTSRQTCGSCHFTGGGGNAVKHGDLDNSLLKPGPYLDVHMSPEGQNFRCSDCHQSDQHEVQGSRYTATAADPDGLVTPGKEKVRKASCASCHDNTPHSDTKLNEHTDKVACQTCHIPEFARGGFATKMWWDWSTAGKRKPDGKPLVKNNEKGEQIYHGKKGDFVWGSNVVPEYEWFNGTVSYTLLEDKIDPDEVVMINKFEGSPDDPDSRIWPIKVMRGKQIYDAGNNTLAVLHTFGKDKTAYWTNYDFGKAVEAGMEYVGAPYSGKYGFVRTEMRWPITHMVSPTEDAVGCGECHSRDGRMKNVPGVYMPGRDYNSLVDTLGYIAIVLAFIGVLVHGGIRLAMHVKNQE